MRLYWHGCRAQDLSAIRQNIIGGYFILWQLRIREGRWLYAPQARPAFPWASQPLFCRCSTSLVNCTCQVHSWSFLP